MDLKAPNFGPSIRCSKTAPSSPLSSGGETTTCCHRSVVWVGVRKDVMYTVSHLSIPASHTIPYYSHTTPIRIPKDMGIVWEAYHKGVPLVGVPGITLDC